MIHYNFIAPQAMHQWCFVSSVDPALDATNQVTANKAWFDSSHIVLYLRNSTNSGWTLIG